ncbi:hypothetical protein [Robiginitalea sp. SC105]|uniref:hypothetical protein n=1 Tax=Robiginitalea sp. SC105 TaxID=2762332 RepID=UPI001639CBB1|nr:hypothetical protein [Robiginitalea sp. SC105]MBC2839570.1 hypothetical protein [Robiginitalea sp. SC105]
MICTLPLSTGLLLLASFLSTVGPSLLIATSGAAVLTAGIYHFFEIPRQQRVKRQWLRSHSDAIRSHLIVQYCLNRWKEDQGHCSKCGSRNLELWDHRDNLLVLRCSGCRINYTLTEHSGPMIAKILQNMPAEYVVVSGLRENRYDLLGHHLRRSCGPCTTFVENKLSDS